MFGRFKKWYYGEEEFYKTRKRKDKTRRRI